jgi:hypothetical protein
MQKLSDRVIQEILTQSQQSFALAKRQYHLALTTTAISVCISLGSMGAVAAGKLGDRAIAATAQTLPLVGCVQLLNSARKHIASASEQLNEVLDNL